MARKPAKEKRIEKALQEQLALKGADLEHYRDLLSDYMDLWRTKNKLIADIEERGVNYQEPNSTGNQVWKSNPSVKELVMVNRQMLAILKELKLSTDDVGGEDDAL